MNNENNIVPINEDLNVVKYEIDEIKQKIYTARGKQVILDSDIAKLYEVETRVVNQAVKRNIERFPEDFCFQLTESEYNSLKSQFVILKNYTRGQHTKYLPYVFTEQGVAMLSAVLRSTKAIQVSINIMKAFIEMRAFILKNQILFEKISDIELKQIKYQELTDSKFEKVFEYIGNHEEKEQNVFFDGQVYDAFSMMIDLIKKAKKEIILIDNYADVDTLNILAKKNEMVNVKIYTKKETKLNSKDINKFNTQYPKLEVKYTEKFHDRFMILDKKYIYHIGASLKDLGKKCFGITLIKYDAIIEDILSKLDC